MKKSEVELEITWTQANIYIGKELTSLVMTSAENWLHIGSVIQSQHLCKALLKGVISKNAGAYNLFRLPWADNITRKIVPIWTQAIEDCVTEVSIRANLPKSMPLVDSDALVSLLKGKGYSIAIIGLETYSKRELAFSLPRAICFDANETGVLWNECISLCTEAVNTGAYNGTFYSNFTDWSDSERPAVFSAERWEALN